MFIHVLRDCGALQVVYPEIDALFGVPQPEKWHPEIDTGLHQLLALREAVKLGGGVPARFAVLMHDLGKAATPAEILPSHHGHEDAGVALVEQLCNGCACLITCANSPSLATRYHTHVHRAMELRADTVLKTLESCDALRRPERFADFLLACEADARGRTGLEDRDYPQRALLRAAASATPPWRSRQKNAADFPANRSGRNCADAASPPSKSSRPRSGVES